MVAAKGRCNVFRVLTSRREGKYANDAFSCADGDEDDPRAITGAQLTDDQEARSLQLKAIRSFSGELADGSALVSFTFPCQLALAPRGAIKMPSRRAFEHEIGPGASER
jgi:hypothetical protein